MRLTIVIDLFLPASSRAEGMAVSMVRERIGGNAGATAVSHSLDADVTKLEVVLLETLAKKRT